jgi:SpoVK/Ycf46/Vps4 family AAA+-type ATPase
MRRRRRKTFATFDKTFYAEKELHDKLSLWMIRSILKSGGHREFIDSDNYFSKEEVALFLDLKEYVSKDNEEYSRNEVLQILEEKLEKLESQKEFGSNKVLAKNINQLSELMKLNKYEEQVLEFAVMLHQYDILSECLDCIGNDLNTSQIKRHTAIILDIPIKQIEEVFSSSSKLIKSSILQIYKRSTNDFKRKLEPISDDFFDNLLNLDEDISTMIKHSVKKTNSSELKKSDYKHIKKDINILLPYLKKSLLKKKKGVNILLYGLPGTGKTELCRVLANELKSELFEVSYVDEDDEPIDGHKRLKSYKIAQALLSNKNSILMYDEAEDIFQSNDFFFAPKRQKDKAWINKTLETNTIPTIWVTNNIRSIDNAIVRRFDMSIELPIPSKSKREQIIKKTSKEFLSKETIKSLAENENIAPALITKTQDVLKDLYLEDKDEAFFQVINNTLKAQGYKEHNNKKENIISKVYDTDFINSDTDINELVVGIENHQNVRLCIYGASGTGKSEFGKYISKTLDKPYIIKKASDLISKWVGETEQNIANAFNQARQEDSILIFDEVDTFLSDRSSAKNSWEVSQVNEMLVQMESFDGVFIATTNLMENIDQASLRRFDLKMKFDYLKSNQSLELFMKYCKNIGIKEVSEDIKDKVANIQKLSSGDFNAIIRQSKFRPIKDDNDFYIRLKEEVAVKKLDNANKMGFI